MPLRTSRVAHPPAYAAQAVAAYDQIRGGAKFETVARQKSIDGSAQQGGILGCVTPEEFAPAFQKVAETAPLGVITQPLHTQYGWHLILVREWDPSVTSNPQVAQAVAQAAYAAVDKRLGDPSFKVHVDPRFGSWARTDDVRRPACMDRGRAGVTQPARPARQEVSGARVVVVGLGPAGVELMVPAAREALARVPVRYTRTSRHPAVAQLAADGLELAPLDILYDSGDDLDTVYAAIAARVVAEAQEHGEVAYAVPGSPSVAERTVELLRAAGIDVEIVPGLSFADLAWNRLGVDPMAGVRVVDARAFAVDAAAFSGRMLLAQCDTRFVCSEVKLALLEDLPPEHDVTVLERLGLPDEHVFTVPLAELDRVVEPDHLTSLYVDSGEVAVGAALARLVVLTERLRGPGGCPWDAAQTHHSLRRHVLEEAYEVAEAIGDLPADAPAGDIAPGAYDALEDELGDLLFQVMIHSALASEAGAFTIADVARHIHEKLVHRHPHVFGDVRVHTADAVVTNWEQIKKQERGNTSLVEGITPGLPSLLYAQKLFRKASSVGLAPDLPHLEMTVADEDALGVALAALAAAGARAGVDGESALAGWARRFKDRFVRMEQLAADAGVDLAAVDGATVEGLWSAAGSGAT